MPGTCPLSRVDRSSPCSVSTSRISPFVETKLGGGEFEAAMKGQKGMAVNVLVRKAIAEIEAGKIESRPGLSNMLYLMSRLVPSLPFGQMAKLVRTAS